MTGSRAVAVSDPGARLGAVRWAVVASEDGGAYLCPLDSAGRPAAEVVHEPSLAEAVRSRPHVERWVWRSTAEIYRPLLAAGNSNGDIPMLQFSEQPERPSLQLLLVHDDPTREFDYQDGAERAIDLAGSRDWTAVSIRDDWATVFDRRG